MVRTTKLGRRYELIDTPKLARRGRYDEAFACMEGVDELSLRTLKSYHIWTAALGILKVQRYLHW